VEQSAEGSEDLPPEAEQLYRAPLADFTRARNELAKRLAGEGRRDAAEWVRRLKKPRLSAWAINRLAHDASDDIERLLETSRRIEAADSGAAMRGATRERHTLVSELVARAGQILQAAGQSTSGATLHQVQQTLYAITNEEERDRLRRGVLTEPLEGSGFGDVLTMPDAATFTDPRAEERRARAGEELRHVRDELREAEQDASRLRREAERARRALAVAEDEAATAERRVERLRDAQQAAEAAVSEAERT
jgi:hypothetical protein